MNIPATYMAMNDMGVIIFYILKGDIFIDITDHMILIMLFIIHINILRTQLRESTQSRFNQTFVILNHEVLFELFKEINV